MELFQKTFLKLVRLPSAEWEASLITGEFVVLAELWGYFSSLSEIPPPLIKQVRYLTVTCQIVFSAVFYGETSMDQDSNILAPIFLEHPQMIIDAAPLLSLLRNCRTMGGKFWSSLIIQCGEELIHAHSVTFGGSPLTENLDIRLLAVKVIKMEKTELIDPSYAIKYYATP